MSFARSVAAALATAVLLGAPTAGCGEPGAPQHVGSPERAESVTSAADERGAAAGARAPTPETAPKPETATARGAGPIVVELAVEGTGNRGPAHVEAAAPIPLRLVVRNEGVQPVSLRFASGRTYDVVLLDDDGREQWRWSAGRMFAQVISELEIEAGDASKFELVCDPAPAERPSLPPGHYRAIGLLPTFDGEIRSAPVEIVLE